jgi:hypothetical protein
LQELDPSLDETEPGQTYNTALVVLSALTCGPNIVRLAAFTGLPRVFVAAIYQRMIQAELWTEAGVCSDHWQCEEGVLDLVAFWLDMLIAEELVIRRWDEEEGDYWYCGAACAHEGEDSGDVN